MHRERTGTFAGNNCSPQPTPGRHRTGSMAYLVGKLYRETKKERTDTLIQNAPIANCLPTGSTADRIAEQFNVSGRAEARLHIVCLPADPARDHVLIPPENAGRRIDDMSRANDHITPDK